MLISLPAAGPGSKNVSVYQSSKTNRREFASLAEPGAGIPFYGCYTCVYGSAYVIGISTSL